MHPRFIKLAVFYFFYFGFLGIYIPYWPLYLKDLGFSVSEIGELMAILFATKIMAPYLWGWIGDHWRVQLALVRWGAFLTAVSFALIFFGSGYMWIAVTVALFSFFWNALLSQFEVITLDSLRYQSHYYGRIRLWGSIGFVTAAAIGSMLIAAFDTTVIPGVIAVIFILLWIAGVQLSPPGITRSAPVPSLYRAMDISIMALLVISCIIQLSHGTYYAYFTLFLEQNGYDRTLIGQLWSLSVVFEIVLLALVSPLLRHTGPVALLTLVTVCTVLRWMLVAYLPQHLGVIIFTQFLHAITYGVYHATMMYALAARLPQGLKGRGQALYSLVSFGIGGGIGAYIASVLWQPLGGALVFVLSAAIGTLAFLFLIPLRKVRFR